MTPSPTTPDFPQRAASMTVPPAVSRPRRSHTYLFVALVVAGIAFRFSLVLLAGNTVNAPWGGVGDAPAYVLLAHNLAAGKGYAYAGHSTAYRAPFYPIALAASIKLFSRHALRAVRLIQFAAGLLIAWLCAAIAGRIFGSEVKRATFVIALFLPTLIEMTGDILTETIATLMSLVFFYLLVRFLKRPAWGTLAGLSAVVGIATLARFNMALFGFVVLAGVLFQQSSLKKWKAVALAIFLSALVISPWLIRNFVAFHGALLLSTVSGPTAAMGVLTPEGRALPGDSERLRSALGWVPPADLETNDASRDALGEESDLNRQAWRVTFGLWRQAGWRLLPLNLEKLSYFWLSTDQLFFTGSFRPVVRAARATGVLAYWVILALGMGGWFRLRTRWPALAHLLLFYALLVTVLHLPFNMNTRLRIPFIDPLLVILAGGECLALYRKFTRADFAVSSNAPSPQ